MENEGEICRRYEAELAAIAALDRRYYVNPSPSLADRAHYATRQSQLENTRSMLYAELNAFRQNSLSLPSRCRSVIQRSHVQRRPR
jgi:hypothetical protein